MFRIWFLSFSGNGTEESIKALTDELNKVQFDKKKIGTLTNSDRYIIIEFFILSVYK